MSAAFHGPWKAVTWPSMWTFSLPPRFASNDGTGVPGSCATAGAANANTATPRMNRRIANLLSVREQREAPMDWGSYNGAGLWVVVHRLASRGVGRYTRPSSGGERNALGRTGGWRKLQRVRARHPRRHRLA